MVAGVPVVVVVSDYDAALPYDTDVPYNGGAAGAQMVGGG